MNVVYSFLAGSAAMSLVLISMFVQKSFYEIKRIREALEQANKDRRYLG